MDEVQNQFSDGTAMGPNAQDSVDRDELYGRVAAEFGPPLARLAAAYEFEPSRQEDLLQELHFALSFGPPEPYQVAQC